MEIKKEWHPADNFEVWYPEQWAKIEALIGQLSSTGTCLIGQPEDYWVNFVFRDEKYEISKILEYPTDELHSIDIDKLRGDFNSQVRFPNRKERKLLQAVFNACKSLNTWPSSRDMSTDLEDLGNYYKIAEGIGHRYINVGDPYDPDAISQLTIRGIALCEGSSEFKRLFIKVLKAFVKRYRKSPRIPLITSEELVDVGIVDESAADLIYSMIWNEHGLVSGGTTENSGLYTYTIAPTILDYKNVSTVREYLHLIDKPEQDDTSGEAEAKYSEPKPDSATDDKIMEYDLFISYSSKDRAEAIKIREKAQTFGLKCFLDKKDIKKGKYWDPEIRDALRKSREIAVLATPNSIASEWIYAEAGAAWVLDKDLTPIILRCDFNQLHPLLQQREGIDYHEIDEFLKELSESKNVT